MLGAHQLALGGWQRAERIVGGVDGADAHQALNAFGILADGCFEEAAPAVSPAAYERDAVLVVVFRRAPLQDVVDVAGVTLEEAIEAPEELLDEVLRVPLGIG